MRQVQIQLQHGRAADAVAIAERHGAATLSWWSAHSGTGDQVDMLSLTLPNARLEGLLEDLEAHGPIEASLPSTGAFAFQPPSSTVPDALDDITPRSPLELYLSGRQSAGGWAGFLSYAVIAGVVVWIGLFTETIFLLTASMLLAPFAGPAMNTAIGLVSGDTDLLRHSVARYAAGIGTTAAACALLTLAVGQTRITGLTSSVLSVSVVAVLLPLAAGAAGATHLAQSEHSSLVSGAAVGMLVAASLAPPTGGLGIAVALGRWDLLGPGLFLVVLQLTGITLVAAGVFRLYGLSARQGRFSASRRRLLAKGVGVTTLVLGLLLVIQVVAAPTLQRSSLVREAGEVAAAVVESDPQVDLLEVRPRVPLGPSARDPRVIIEVDAQAAPDVASTRELESDLARRISGAVRRQVAHVEPVTKVTVHPAG